MIIHWVEHCEKEKFICKTDRTFSAIRIAKIGKNNAKTERY